MSVSEKPDFDSLARANYITVVVRNIVGAVMFVSFCFGWISIEHIAALVALDYFGRQT